MSTIVPDTAYLQHEIEQLAVKAGRIILQADRDQGSRLASDPAASIRTGAEGQGADAKSSTETRGTDARSGLEAAAAGSHAPVTIARKSSRRDLVTSRDLEIQRMLMKRLSIFCEDCRFLCEEDLDVKDLPLQEKQLLRDPAEVRWGTCFIIDPIDGTANFVHGCRHSCTSIAMTVDGETRIGVVYDPYRQELFSACRGRGAWLNGHRLPVFDAGLADAITVFGTAPYDDSTNESTFRLARLLYEHSADVRRTGSAALDCCWTACGRFGLYAELALSAWDFAAGKLIAEETGCLVTDIQGRPLPWTGKPSILCGRPSAIREFLALCDPLPQA